MFTLLNPFALLALSGLVVPVAIHLWNRRPGREVAVGSLRWLAAGANRRLRHLKPEQLALLLLRTALLAVLAVAVAGPVWRQTRPSSRGQVLISPALRGNPAVAVLRPAIDSLRRRGYALRWLAAGFPRVPGGAWRASLAGRRAGLRGAGSTAGFDWARVQQAVGAFPGQPLFVVTTSSIRNFQGIHAPLPAAVSWQTLPVATAETWLQGAAVRGDSLRLLLGRSTEAQTNFRLVSVARPRPGAVLRVAGLAPLRFETSPEGSQIRLLNTGAGLAIDSVTNPTPPVPVRTRPVRAVIYATAAYAPEARYLRAGLRAAAAGLLAPLELRVATASSALGAAPDWLFWLSDAPLPAAGREAARTGAGVWQEAAGPGIADTAHLATVAPAGAGTAIFRRGAPAGAAGAGLPLWADGQGRPVLARQAAGRGAFYNLHTRLNPAWSELADDPALPARLLALLQPEPTDDIAPNEPALADAGAAHDQRALDPAQLFSNRQHAAHKPLPSGNAGISAPSTAADLRPWLVLAAGLLFIIERLLAFRREARATTSTV